MCNKKGLMCDSKGTYSSFSFINPLIYIYGISVGLASSILWLYTFILTRTIRRGFLWVEPNPYIAYTEIILCSLGIIILMILLIGGLKNAKSKIRNV